MAFVLFKGLLWCISEHIDEFYTEFYPLPCTVSTFAMS